MAGVAFAAEGDGVGFATESYAASALYTTLASLSGALWRIRRARCDRVAKNPTAEWIARQITQALPWDDAPKYLIRDRDQIYGAVVTRRLRHGHSGQAHRTSFALAERLCRTADRIDPA